MLQNLLDPIDWATYEPFLWSNAQAFYQRTATLFGALAQLQVGEVVGLRIYSAAGGGEEVLMACLLVGLQHLPSQSPTSHGRVTVPVVLLWDGFGVFSQVLYWVFNKEAK